MNAGEILAEVQRAEAQIRPHVRETPLEESPHLSEQSGAQVFLKLECQQLSGSFKLRGALNKVLSLSPAEREKPLVTASSGNHAAAMAYALHGLGGQCIIYLPETVATAKVDALRPYGAELRFEGSDSFDGELQAKEAARRDGLIYVSPYSDPQIVGGQGTVAVEIERQGDPADAVFVPVGGGGLISGIAGYMKSRDPSCRIIGCQPEHSRVMVESVRAGRILDLESRPTLADGTAGGVERETVTFEPCRELVDDWVLVSEDEIAASMRLLLEKHYLLVEGAAALSVASFLKSHEAYRGKVVVLVISGKKVSLDTLRKVLSA